MHFYNQEVTKSSSSSSARHFNHIEVGQQYNLINSSLTAEGVNTARSVNSRVIYDGGV